MAFIRLSYFEAETVENGDAIHNEPRIPFLVSNFAIGEERTSALRYERKQCTYAVKYKHP